MDASGNLYATAYEHNAIFTLRSTGVRETLAWDPRLVQPDGLTITPDRYLYVAANQLHRRGMFHESQNQRQPPYQIFTIRLSPAEGDAR